MASNEAFSNYGSIGSGFYYDQQKINPLMSVTLHSNNSTSDGGVTWADSWSGDKDTEGYGLDPLCTALLNEDFSVAIANNWSEFDAGNMLESAWNSIRPAGAYIENVDKLMDKMVNTGKDWIKNHTDGSSTWAEKLNNGLGKAREFIGKHGNYLNHALVVQGTRFSYYAGTGNAFSNLNMKFTLFADYVVDKNGNSSKKLVTVHKQLEKLYPYIMGKYVNVDGSNKGGEAKEPGSLDEFFGWQKAPGGFKPDIKNIDTTVVGTLKLKFGSYYSIRNLVCRDAQLNFSKQMVKDPSNPGELSPLYCDIILSFQAATKFSDLCLRNFIEGDSTKTERNDIKTKINDSLDTVKSDMTSIIKNYSALL